MTYAVRETERAESEGDQAFFRILSIVGPEYAEAWHQGLLTSIAGLADFPGPSSHSLDELASRHYGYTVRRLLYTGPTKRKSSVAWRVLFTLLAPDAEGISAILVLRVIHGARLLDSNEDYPLAIL